MPLLPRTIVLSVGMHFAVVLAALRAPEGPARADPSPARDVWSGQAVEVDAVTLPGEDSTTVAAPAEPAGGAPRERGSEPEPAEAAPTAKTESSTEPRSKPTSKAEPRPATKEKRPPREPGPKPVASSAPASTGGESLGAAPASAPPEPGARGAFGMTGLPRGVRHLPKAFTRTLSEALSGDKTWLTMPLGPAGEIELSISVDSEGKLGELSYPKPELAAKQAEVLKRAAERTMLMLRAGTFSLAPNQLQNGVQRLRLEFEVSGELSSGEDELDRFQKGFVEPSGGRPGKSYFVSSSGRRVEARVYVLP